MSKDTIYREDAIDEMERIMADHPLQGYEDELLLIDAIKSLPSADRPQVEDGEDYLRGYNDGYHAREVLDKARVEIHIDKPRGFTLKSISDKQTKEAGRPQGEWIDKGDYAECSNCGADSGIQFDGVESVPRKTNFCPNCGARMDVSEDDRDYERAVEMAEYERLYEPTYNPEDGSM